MEAPEDLVSTLEGQVERLKVIFEEQQQALDDDVSEVSHFCVTLECILRHQQKEKVSFWGERRDYWHYLSEGVGSMKTLEVITKYVQTLAQLTTGQGRGRALIRRCLSEHLLADYLQISLSNSKRTKEWYFPSAVLLLPSLAEKVISALYDLSEVDFRLPSEGIDLDEMWPSFVIKSFQSNSPESRKSLFRTQDAKAADRKRAFQGSALERATEEQPSEVYVKQEIPFTLEEVGMFLADIRSSLIGQDDDDHAPHRSLPPLKVAKMDDITSCLCMLNNFISSWSRDISMNTTALRAELKRSNERLQDLELQLQDTILQSESSESDLLTQLQYSKDEFKVCSEQFHRNSDENTILKGQLSEARQKISELEALNFTLEEELIEASNASLGGGAGGRREEAEGRRQRTYTLLESTLSEKDKEIEDLRSQLQQGRQELSSLQTTLLQTRQALHQTSGYPALLQTRLATECEAKALIGRNLLSLELRHAQLEREHQESLRDFDSLRVELLTSRESEGSLRTQFSELESWNADLNYELEEVKHRMEAEVELRRSLELERDTARDELQSMHGLVENETQSLRFRLSSQTMELQQANQLVAEQEQTISSLQKKTGRFENQLRDSEERREEAESQIDELRQELQDLEGILQTHQVEMSSLHEQLTEKTLSRDVERAHMLKLQNEFDSVHTRVQVEKQDYSRQVKRLTEENEDIRRAFKKLLQQKVTLWQHADELEQEQVAMGTWLDSKTVIECMGCSTPFSVFHRKHHCRSCGKVFCTECCDKKAQLPYSKDPVRVCNKCESKISQLRTPFASKMVNTLLETDSLGGSVGHAPLQGSLEEAVPNGSSNSLNIERSVEVNGNSLQAKLLLQNSDTPSSLEVSEVSGTEGTDLVEPSSLDTSVRYLTAPTSINPDDFEPLSLQKSCSSNDYHVEGDGEKDGAEGGKESGVTYRICTVEGSTEEDSYYLIETKPKGSEFPVGLDSPGSAQLDLNALASKLASLEPSNFEASQYSMRTLTASVISRVGGLTNGSADADIESCEVMLSGGESHQVCVEVSSVGTVVAWEFSTEPKGIAFGISYKETEMQNVTEEEVLPLRRCVSHKTTLTGEYVAQKAGVYLLKFDNRHSKYSGRKLQYKIWKKVPP